MEFWDVDGCNSPSYNFENIYKMEFWANKQLFLCASIPRKIYTKWNFEGSCGYIPGAYLFGKYIQNGILRLHLLFAWELKQRKIYTKWNFEYHAKNEPCRFFSGKIYTKWNFESFFLILSRCHSRKIYTKWNFELCG